ncbi:MAG: hypothetical protein VXZ70_06005, partial [Pseudomonadota bacterium]|nr:hypothetical protein [Pseudomonadota bacterium]
AGRVRGVSVSHDKDLERPRQGYSSGKKINGANWNIRLPTCSLSCYGRIWFRVPSPVSRLADARFYLNT